MGYWFCAVLGFIDETIIRGTAKCSHAFQYEKFKTRKTCFSKGASERPGQTIKPIT